MMQAHCISVPYPGFMGTLLCLPKDPKLERAPKGELASVLLSDLTIKILEFLT